jgi:hypothetical protein
LAGCWGSLKACWFSYNAGRLMLSPPLPLRLLQLLLLVCSLIRVPQHCKSSARFSPQPLTQWKSPPSSRRRRVCPSASRRRLPPSQIWREITGSRQLMRRRRLPCC